MVQFKKHIDAVLWVVFVVIVFTGCATAPMSEEDRQIERIVEFRNLERAELYAITNRWFVETFNDAESVIEYQDAEGGTIMGKYTEAVTAFGPLALSTINRYRATIRIDTRDGALRARISEPSIFLTGSGVRMWREPNKSEYERIDFRARANRVIASLEQYVQNNADDSW